ncbi:hypothetical protein EHP00_2284 [Ecytonucleospora hepatopenaei]|uniref:Uncharacterized protein n=1 Tax=Ecytonucleospora hepatopenaei TaxID=646526 RepID=A0A1W0E3K7_9MICR|nr:hypothetical protein EHP00_2284 [Ecytonucleospora hepatopenaei]
MCITYILVYVNNILLCSNKDIDNNTLTYISSFILGTIQLNTITNKISNTNTNTNTLYNEYHTICYNNYLIKVSHRIDNTNNTNISYNDNNDNNTNISYNDNNDNNTNNTNICNKVIVFILYNDNQSYSYNKIKEIAEEIHSVESKEEIKEILQKYTV